jgi:murein L,D-transpeptidase YcbB/YkuD
LVVLLSWALRPPARGPRPPLDAFEALHQLRHSSRMSHILQALQPQDTEHLRSAGQAALMQTIRRQRRVIAQNYLQQLQEEFELLLEISRALAVMSPEVIAMEEMERWKLSLAFAANCAFLKWKLRLGLQPFSGFTLLSNMATSFAQRLEAATARIAETTVRSAEPSGSSHELPGSF